MRIKVKLNVVKLNVWEFVLKNLTPMVNALWVSGVTHATKIKNPACLVCHDTPDRAPTSMLAIYGDKGGFG